MLVLLSQMELSAENQGDLEPTAKSGSSRTSQCSSNGKVEGTSPAKAYLAFCLSPKVVSTGGRRSGSITRLPYPLAGSAAILLPQVSYIRPK